MATPAPKLPSAFPEDPPSRPAAAVVPVVVARPTLARWPEWATALALLGMALFHVWQRQVSLATLLAWLGAVGLVIHISCRGERRRLRLLLTPAESMALLIVLVGGLGQLWRLSSDLNHYHPDEFILAYTSYDLRSVVSLDWFADYPEVWTARFPVFFHVLQKPFFAALGPSLETMRVSIWPYYIAIFGYTFALGRLVFSRRVGMAAGVVWLFLGANLYMASMGLQIIGSTCFYMAALFHFLAALRVRSRRHAALAGVFAACCYLIYPSSYVAVPVLGLMALPELVDAWRRARRPSPIADMRAVVPVLVATALVFAVTLAPFVLYAVHVRNFLVARAAQVNLFSGDWVHVPGSTTPPISRLIVKQAWDATRALVVPGLSGNIGFDFGHLALMDRKTAALMATGFLICLWLAVRRRERASAAVVVAFVVPFVVNGILTQHPPPFHRMSVFFPILSLFVGCPIGLAADKIARRSRAAAAVVLVAALALAVRWNVAHVDAMLAAEHNSGHGPALARWLDAHLLPGETFYMDAPWTIGIVHEMLFRTGGRYRILADELPKILSHYTGGPLILFWPDAVKLQKLVRRFPDYELFYELDGVPLGYAALFVGKPPAPAPPSAVGAPGAAVQGANMFEGGCGADPGEMDTPLGMAVAPSGDVFIADSNNHRVQRYTADGEYRGGFGHLGRGPGQLNRPSGIAVDESGQLYVSDSWNHRVLRMAPEGGEVQADFSAGGLYAPFGLVTDGGELFVANTGLANVVRFGADGQVLATWGERGHGPGQFSDHTSVAVVKDAVFVADPLNARIGIFDRAGHRTGEWPVAEWTTNEWRWAQLLADPKRGRIYASVPQKSAVLVFDLDGRRLVQLDIRDGKGELLGDATALAFDRDGHGLLVLDTRGCRVVRSSLPTRN